MKNFRILGLLIIAALAFTSCDEALDLLSDDPRDAFVGDWSVTENSARKTLPVYYEVSISKSASDSTLVRISNFYDIGHNQSVDAEVTGGTITIGSQTRDGFTFQGSGNIAFNDKTIDWNYSVDYNNGTPAEQVTATYTKQ